MFQINNDKPGVESLEVTISRSIKFEDTSYIDILHYTKDSNDELYLSDSISLDVKQTELLIDMLQSRLKVIKGGVDKPLDNEAVETLYIFTDGGSSGNPGFGGWAYVVTANREIIKQVHNTVAYPNVTNGMMELTAVNEALRWLAHTPFIQAKILSDSRYVVDGINKSQKRNVNKVLWYELDKWRERLGARVSFEWIARDSDPFNTMADNLSKKVR